MKYEYKTEFVTTHEFKYCDEAAAKVDKILKPLGEEGWELVSACPNTGSFGWWLFLKRPVK
ncbi:MAG: DUF4177 domain-containing protein [Clostridia bacterium]|nr:DUF4177 domain-containing protein [Clostridia bacterium]